PPLDLLYSKLITFFTENPDKFNRKNFFIVLHLIWAEIHGQDLKKVKGIVHHHHFLIKNYGYFFETDDIRINLSVDHYYIDKIKSDFNNNFKLIISVRNF